MSSLETRSTSAMHKRAEQLRRWTSSSTARESVEPRQTSRRRVNFTDGCVFLAACAAGDTPEVARLLQSGAHIDTANVDGLTALHQACIDDNLDMVEFLVTRGADINAGDNEGWTPLHATASCGFISIAKYLIEHGAQVSAVNNDGELAIDIAESDEMEDLLQREIDKQNIDCEQSRRREEQLMLNDARQWLQSGCLKDTPHFKTGATALHVAAAKGYNKVITLLLQAGANVDVQDNDGWTPLHAAAHWAQREACQLLCCDGSADMEVKNLVGQTCFDVADPDILRFIEDLKKKQTRSVKDSKISEQPQLKTIISRSPHLNQNASKRRKGSDDGDMNEADDRSSITRLSVDDKAMRSKENTTQERDLLLNKRSLATQIIHEADAVVDDEKSRHQASDSDDNICKAGFEDAFGLSESELVHMRTKAGLEASKRNRAHHDFEVPRIVTNRAKADRPDAEERVNKSTTEEDEIHPWRRPASLRVRPTYTSHQQTSSKFVTSPSKEEEDSPLRRVHSFQSDEKFYARLTELRNRIRASSMPVLPASPVRSSSNQCSITSRPEEERKTTVFQEHRPLQKTRGLVGSAASENIEEADRNNAFTTRQLPVVVEAESPTPSLFGEDSSNHRKKPLFAGSNQMGLAQSSCYGVIEDQRCRESLKVDVPKNVIQVPPSNRLCSSSPLITDFLEPRKCVLDEQDLQRSSDHLTSSRNAPTNLEIWKRREDLGRLRTPDGKVTLNTSGLQPQNIRSDNRTRKGSTSSTSTAEVLTQMTPAEKAGITSVVKQFFKSFVPPVRDEESETQRKAHAKRVRETRRSTQGVTLEDLKSAEQLVKKKQQQENQQRTSELQQLVASASSSVVATTPDQEPERRPSWRLRAEERSKFRLESESKETPTSTRESNPASKTPTTDSISTDFNSSSKTSSPSAAAVQRRKKPKRRSTGVVQLDLDDATRSEDADEVDEPDDDVMSTRETQGRTSSDATRVQNGGGGTVLVDYKKLWEESQKENAKLRDDVLKLRDELTTAKRQLETSVQQSAKVSLSRSTADDRGDKKSLEKKLVDMEEELKHLEHLKNDNQRLRDENGALIRVISKLSK